MPLLPQLPPPTAALAPNLQNRDVDRALPQLGELLRVREHAVDVFPRDVVQLGRLRYAERDVDRLQARRHDRRERAWEAMQLLLVGRGSEEVQPELADRKVTQARA